MTATTSTAAAPYYPPAPYKGLDQILINGLWVAVEVPNCSTMSIRLQTKLFERIVK